MLPVSEEEFDITVRDLPNGKASGISNISYEMIKKLGKEGKKAIRKFYTLCLKTSQVPESWKISSIFSIPKPKE